MLKKIIAGVVALTALFAFAVTVSAQTSSYAFMTNLTIGSTGPDVVSLQTFLESKGFLVMPVGVAKGYFGGLTKSALAKYQASKSITPAVGYFGPVTRAAVNAEGAVVVGPTTPGCPAGAMYNSMTGAPCTTTSTPTTSSTEGTLDVRQAGTPANNANIQSSVDVPVYGLTLKATIADVTVDRLDLKVGVNSTTNGTETPSQLINTIKVWDGSTLVKSWSVTSADFIKDVNNSTVYYVRLSGLGFVVPKDATKNLVVSFSTNGGIDTDRNVSISGYGANSLRAVSGNNITSYYDISGISRAHVFKKPGAATLSISSDGNNPIANNTKVNATNGVTGVTVGTFNVKSETGDSVITDVTVPVVASGTIPSTVWLYDGSTALDSRTPSGGTVTFSNLRVAAPQDTYKTLTVKVDMPAATATGTSVSISSSTANSLSVTYQKPNGNTATAQATAIDSDTQYFFSAAPVITFVSATATVGNQTVSGVGTTTATANFIFKVKPNGSPLYPFVSGSTTVKYSTSTLSTATTQGITSTSVTIDGNPSMLSDGTEYTVTVTAVLTPGSVPAGTLPTTSILTFFLTNINWVTATGIVTNQTYGLDSYKTNAVTVTK